MYFPPPNAPRCCSISLGVLVIIMGIAPCAIWWGATGEDYRAWRISFHECEEMRPYNKSHSSSMHTEVKLSEGKSINTQGQSLFIKRVFGDTIYRTIVKYTSLSEYNLKLLDNTTIPFTSMHNIHLNAYFASRPKVRVKQYHFHRDAGLQCRWRLEHNEVCFEVPAL